MLRIGILRGMENSFPEALIQRINDKAKKIKKDIVGEFVSIGGLQMDAPNPYAVILDRISQDVAFYRTYLKHAVMQGTYVINNPFWWSADDKFFNYALMHKIGVAIPKTVVLPQNAHPEGTTTESMRNMIYPLNWDEIFGYVGFPAFLKPHSGGGWKQVYKVHSADDFFHYYNQTGTTCMVLQENVDFEEYYRCYCVGQKDVHIMEYNPKLPYGQQYLTDAQPINSKLKKRMHEDILKICQTLGYDLNTVEFAVRDGVPYAIDFLNPAPDADYHSVSPKNFEWIVEKVADFLIECALKKPVAIKEFHWSKFLKPQSISKSAKAAATKKALVKRDAPSKSPKKKAR
jgi:glutathione synthase/RimK-type ligase-like ATP-grasp enzyme